MVCVDGQAIRSRPSLVICLIGHSGCGKTTLLNMVAGFNKPTTGEVRLQSDLVTEPGPERMMVFQNYSLLPCMTAFDNVYLSIDAVHPNMPAAQKKAIAL